jgi:hypothetical protein
MAGPEFEEAGPYSWMPGDIRWMHNPDGESIGVSITFQSSGARESGPTPVTVARYEGTYEQRPLSGDGIRTELWRVDFEDTTVVNHCRGPTEHDSVGASGGPCDHRIDPQRANRDPRRLQADLHAAGWLGFRVRCPGWG